RAHRYECRKPNRSEAATEYPLLYQTVNVRQITSITVVIQTITDNKVVRNLKTYIVQVNSTLTSSRLKEHGCYKNLFCSCLLNLIDTAFNSNSCIYDVFKKDHCTTFQLFVEANQFLYSSSASHIFIRGQLDKAYLTRKLDQLKQISRKHKGTVQNTNHKRVFILKILVHLLCHLPGCFLNITARNCQSKLFV